MTDLTALVHDLAEPLVDEAGLDLVDVQVRGAGPRRLVRVVVDRKGGVELGLCQRVSQRLSARLDEVDPIPDGYALEVTSPGIDHPLTDRRSFDRVEGRDVLVHRDRGDGAVVQVRGTVEQAQDDGVLLRTEAGAERVPYREIVKARQSLPW
jgi:ribosome maturation factor RimP